MSVFTIGGFSLLQIGMFIKMISCRLVFAGTRRGHLPSVRGLHDMKSYGPVMTLILEVCWTSGTIRHFKCIE